MIWQLFDALKSFELAAVQAADSEAMIPLRETDAAGGLSC